MTNPHRKAYAYEVRLASLLKANRIIDQSGGSCDIINSWLACEAFQRPIPKYLKEELAQAEKSAGNRLPIAVWREKYQEDRDALVIMRLSDFVEWYV